MNKNLNDLIKKCKGAVYISVNEHRNYYQTADEYIDDLINREVISISEVDENILDKMIELNTIINIHFYLNTPVSFYIVYHYDFNKCLMECFRCIESQEG